MPVRVTTWQQEETEPEQIKLGKIAREQIERGKLEQRVCRRRSGHQKLRPDCGG